MPVDPQALGVRLRIKPRPFFLQLSAGYKHTLYVEVMASPLQVATTIQLNDYLASTVVDFERFLFIDLTALTSYYPHCYRI